MSVKLRTRKNGDGSTTQYLDIYHEGKRSYEFLKNLQLTKASNALDRETNRANKLAAEKIAIKRAAELVSGRYGISMKDGSKTQIIPWMEDFCANYTKKDARVLTGVTARFKTFLAKNKKAGLPFSGLTENLVIDFRDQLAKDCKGEGAASYFSRFKKMIRVAYRDGLVPKNPCEFVTAVKGQPEEKDVLSLDEIKLLSQTPTEAKEVKKAFLFSCLTGLRWCDIKALEWNQIKNGTLKVRQSKTSKIVSINLNKSALKQIGEPGEGLVFDLPTANGANKSLQLWVTRAGINKKISWHSGRHSFGTNLIFEGSDIVTTMTLLGHASLKYTQRYTRASEQLKEKATLRMDIL